MDNIGTAWFVIVTSIISVRAAFAIIKRQLINPVGLLMGGYFGAIGGIAIGGIIGASISRTTANMITLVNPELNIDIYQVTIYGGVSGAIIGTVGGATIGAIGGASPKDTKGITENIFIWLGNIALSLALLMIGIGFSIVLGKRGGLAMYGALSAAMQWYILGGKLSRYEIETAINMMVGFIVWTAVAMLVQNFGGMMVGAIGGGIVELFTEYVVL